MEEIHRKKACAYWLNSLPKIGSKSIALLLDHFGTPSRIYEKCRFGGQHPCWHQGLLTSKQADGALTFTSKWDLELEYNKLLDSGAKFMSWEDPEYPERLRRIPDSPYGLFLKGRLPENTTLAVAVVGARECSEYGKYVAGRLGAALGKAGICLISGMAKGIDGISQKAALEAGGSSVAVLGCGVDICYPKSNQMLYQQLEAQGGILSSYPPGTQPSAGLFPPRNRLVSGLADAVVVVEARQKSGTLITVDMALEQGKEVYAVPGRLTDRLSDGCNKLVKQGAGVVLSPDDFLTELQEIFPDKGCSRGQGVSHTGQSTNSRDNDKTFYSTPPSASLDTADQAVLTCLDFYPRSTEEIYRSLSGKMTFSETQLALSKMCLQGQVQQIGKGYYQLSGD